MRFNKIELENFKCFEKVNIKLGKITLLTGANSSGKSSLVYSLLGALQTDNFPFDYSLNGKYVRMGDYNDVVFKRDITLPIKIGFTYNDQTNVTTNICTDWFINRKNNLPALKRVVIKNSVYELKIHKINKSKNYKLKFVIFKPEELITKLDNESWAKIYDASALSAENVELKSKESFKIFLNNFVLPSKPIEFTFSDFDDLDHLIYSKGNLSLARALDSIHDVLKECKEKTNFISSFRLYPEQTYYEESQKNIKVGRFGEKYQDQLIDWENKKADEFDLLISEMRSLDLIDDIKLQRIGAGRFEVLVRVTQSSIYAALSDVGFGISQFLPIVVADLQLGESSSLIVAQPEIHLHPSVQAKFGDYIFNQVTNHNKSYILETHSEYLLNRVRLAIAKGLINEEDVTVYYLENNGNHSLSHEIFFKKNGQIDNAPNGFFETYMMDVMELALVAE